MSSSVTEKIEDGPSPGAWKPYRETAPSVMREDQPTFVRVIGIIGLFLVGVAAIAMVMRVSGVRSGWIGGGWGTLFSTVGLILMMLHAATDRETQVRRLYGYFGGLWIIIGVVLPFLSVNVSVLGAFGLGFIAQFLGLLFLLAFVRNETETELRQRVILLFGIVGVAMALVAFIGGNVQTDFLVTKGHLLALMGLAYLWSFVTLRGVGDDVGYRAGVGIGVLGALALLVAFGRAVFPQLFFSFGWLSVRPQPYFIPGGLVLLCLGLLYVFFSLGLTSDRRIVVLTRRELSSFFFSPIAYLVLFGITFVGAILFANFLVRVFDGRDVLIEPIVRDYILGWFPIICVLFVVPVLTMRLLSEEKRAGTLEVLLTAPLDETTIVLSKFFAALFFFLTLWLPWGLFLVALRLEGDEPFDYRPLLSFGVCMLCTGAGFVSMGLFFSALTRNQIASAVLTFAGMIALLLVFFAKRLVEMNGPGSAWAAFLNHMSFVDIWFTTLEGKLVIKYLLFHVTAAIFWLFLTVKVLEARKWS